MEIRQVYLVAYIPCRVSREKCLHALHVLLALLCNNNLFIHVTNIVSCMLFYYHKTVSSYNSLSYLRITLPQFTTVYHTLPQFTTIYQTLPYFTRLYQTLPHFTTLYHILPHFTTLYHTLPLFTTLFTVGKLNKCIMLL